MSSPVAVVSGGAGFIGSHVCEALAARGYRVDVIDDLVTGRADNIAGLVAKGGARLMTKDVAEPVAVEGDVRLVLHLASIASSIAFLRYPIETLRTGTLGTSNMLELARRTGSTFLFASTSEVYGDPLVHPQPETYWGNVNPIGVRSSYDEAKRCGEAFTVAYQRMHGVDTRIVRIFNTYGPRIRPDDGRVVSNFIIQALRGEPITVYGDGSQTRSLCYVTDLVNGILAVIDRGDHLPFNLGSDQEITVDELARTVRDVTGSASEILHRELPEDDPKRRRPDLRRTSAVLGWSATVPLREGIRRTVEHLRGEIRA